MDIIPIFPVLPIYCEAYIPHIFLLLTSTDHVHDRSALVFELCVPVHDLFSMNEELYHVGVFRKFLSYSGVQDRNIAKAGKDNFVAGSFGGSKVNNGWVLTHL